MNLECITKQNSRFLSNNRGSSLIFAIVALGAILVVESAILSRAFQQMNSQNRANERIEFIYKMESIRLQVANTDSCTQMMTATGTLLGSPINYPVGTELDLSSLALGPTVLTAGVPDGKVTIDSIKLIDQVQSTPFPTVSGAGGPFDHYRAVLQISGELDPDTHQTFSKSFTLDVLTLAGVVQKCHRGLDENKAVCEVMGGTFTAAGVCTPASLPTMFSKTCPTGQCISGFDESNNAVCRTIPL